ncbi:hypothetical protein [Tabrizicola sp.]|uniref:hypothetical protein n=1 Tax=Tabrizicola sp. TaxID=2005166 RepID=UPI003D287464
MMHRSAKATVLALLLVSFSCDQGLAQELWADTFLLDVYQGSYRSSVAKDLSNGGYELSGGETVDFRAWYSPTLPDLTVLLLKQVSPDLGLIWGISTGEKGEKYEIDQSLHLGFIYQHNPFKNAVLSIKASYPLFGTMTEKTCIADYASADTEEANLGTYTVNCRLANTLISPEETLDYLVNLRGETDAKISVSFSFKF